MKNGKLILTKENVSVVEQGNLKKFCGNIEGSEDLINLIDTLCEDAKRTKKVHSFMLPKKGDLVLIYYLEVFHTCVLVIIKLPKPDELANSVLLMLSTADPFDLLYNGFHLALENQYSTLTYTYTIDFNKEHNKYEVADVDAEGILK